MQMFPGPFDWAQWRLKFQSEQKYCVSYPQLPDTGDREDNTSEPGALSPASLTVTVSKKMFKESASLTYITDKGSSQARFPSSLSSGLCRAGTNMAFFSLG